MSLLRLPYGPNWGNASMHGYQRPLCISYVKYKHVFLSIQVFQHVQYYAKVCCIGCYISEIKSWITFYKLFVIEQTIFCTFFCNIDCYNTWCIRILHTVKCKMLNNIQPICLEIVESRQFTYAGNYPSCGSSCHHNRLESGVESINSNCLGILMTEYCNSI